MTAAPTPLRPPTRRQLFSAAAVTTMAVAATEQTARADEEHPVPDAPTYTNPVSTGMSENFADPTLLRGPLLDRSRRRSRRSRPRVRARRVRGGCCAGARDASPTVARTPGTGSTGAGWDHPRGRRGSAGTKGYRVVAR